MNTNNPSPSAAPASPWWRVGMVWLVLAGPAAVVVAGIVTAVIAVRGAEPVLTSQESTKFSDRPAVQGRNHAATAQQSR
ncbi:MAG: nitrogen fixation protein FixH [Rubrivivax sp.]